MNSARRSLKFHWLCWHSSSCFALNATRAHPFVVRHTVLRRRTRVTPAPFASAGIGAPLTIDADELVERLVRQCVRFGAAERVDRHSELRQIFGAMWTRGQMPLEADDIALGELAVEVLGHQRDGLSADEVVAPPETPSHDEVTSSARRWRTRARARCSSTR